MTLKLLTTTLFISSANGAADSVQVPEKITQVLQVIAGENIRDFFAPFTKNELKLPNLYETYWPRSMIILEGFHGNSYASIELVGNPKLKGEQPLSLDTLAFGVCINTSSTQEVSYPPQTKFRFEFTTTEPCINAHLMLAENADIINTILGIDTSPQIFISTPIENTAKPQRKEYFLRKLFKKKK